ncbi:hypothetical protein ACWJJH_04145 [Endozoicomonadaceae bacterium StTr2]
MYRAAYSALVTRMNGWIEELFYSTAQISPLDTSKGTVQQKPREASVNLVVPVFQNHNESAAKAMLDVLAKQSFVQLSSFSVRLHVTLTQAPDDKY